ncbi:MAG: hypothetical protein PUE71_03245 [Clostridia bacterium]|nr:hypothetical protein [Clostridia bacterium]
MQRSLGLIKYEYKYDEQIEKLDQLSYWKIKFHPDLIRETVYLVIEEEKLLGVAYLVKRSGFLHIDKELIHLYEKMGYRYEKFNFGIQDETGYKAIEY